MKILILTDRFLPEIGAPSYRTMDHAKIWIAQGHEVTVVTCAPNAPHGKLLAGYSNRLFQEEWIDGVRVIRLWTYMTANKGTLRRSLDYASFMASAIAQSWRLPECDVVLASSPPLFTALAGDIIGRLKRRPWVFELRDLWPASIRAVGAADGPLLRQLEKLEHYLYRRATRIVSVTHSFKDHLAERGVDADKIDIATNGVPLGMIGAVDPSLTLRRRLGVADDCFLAGYVGTTGMAHGLETVVEAAARCGSRRDMHFLIMGEGAARSDLEDRAKRLGVQNLTFLDFVPHAEALGCMAALDAAIVHLKPDPLFRTVLPSKIFELMAVGTPILLGVEGESAKVVSAAGCGVCLRPGDDEQLAAAVTELASDRARLAAMSGAGAHAVAEHYTREVNAEIVLQSLAKAIENYHAPATIAMPPLEAVAEPISTRRAA